MWPRLVCAATCDMHKPTTHPTDVNIPHHAPRPCRAYNLLILNTMISCTISLRFIFQSLVVGFLSLAEVLLCLCRSFLIFSSDPVSIDVRCYTCTGGGVNNVGSFYKTSTCQPHLWWRPSLGFWKQSLQLLKFGWYSASQRATSRPISCILLVVLLGGSMNTDHAVQTPLPAWLSRLVCKLPIANSVTLESSDTCNDQISFIQLGRLSYYFPFVDVHVYVCSCVCFWENVHNVVVLGFVHTERFRLLRRCQSGTIVFYGTIHINQRQTSKETVTIAITQSEWTLTFVHCLS